MIQPSPFRCSREVGSWSVPLLLPSLCRTPSKAVNDGQYVVGSGYWPHNISDEKSLLLLYLDWSQNFMIWYGLCPIDCSYMKILLSFLLSFQSKTALIVGYINYTKFYFFFAKLIYSLIMSFDHHICCCLIVCNNLNGFICHKSEPDRFLTWHMFF